MLKAYDSPPDWHFRVMTLVLSGCYTAVVGLLSNTLVEDKRTGDEYVGIAEKNKKEKPIFTEESSYPVVLIDEHKGVKNEYQQESH